MIYLAATGRFTLRRLLLSPQRETLVRRGRGARPVLPGRPLRKNDKEEKMKKAAALLLVLALALTLCACCGETYAEGPANDPNMSGRSQNAIQQPYEAPAPSSAPVSTPTPTRASAPLPTSDPSSTPAQGSIEYGFNKYYDEAQQQTDDAWVLNMNTMKIHYPTCSHVKKIAPKNYSTSNEDKDTPISQGYSMCGVCGR